MEGLQEERDDNSGRYQDENEGGEQLQKRPKRVLQILTDQLEKSVKKGQTQEDFNQTGVESSKCTDEF